MTDMPPQTYRILAVDDDPAILDLYEQILVSDAKRDNKAVEFDLDCCSQGKEAVEAVRLSLEFNQSYAVIFLDLKMPPGPDGEWTARQILKLDPYTNIVLVSGFIRSNPAVSVNQLEPPDKLLYLQKPFHRHEILQFATALSAKWQAEAGLRKLHLEPPLVGVSVLGEDVENQGHSVDDVALERLLEVSLLGRREFVVEHDDVDVEHAGLGNQL